MNADELLALYKTGNRKFRRADLRGAALPNADLTGADLREANLTEANLTRAVLTEADLRGAIMIRAHLGRASLSWANLHGADLRGAYLSRAVGARTDLSGADLSDANLSEAGFQNANLRGASLRRARLTGAGLWSCDLSQADLTGTDLSEAHTRGLNLSGARLPAEQFDETQAFFDASRLDAATAARAPTPTTGSAVGLLNDQARPAPGPPVSCPSCSAENPAGRAFCSRCGSSLEAADSGGQGAVGPVTGTTSSLSHEQWVGLAALAELNEDSALRVVRAELARDTQPDRHSFLSEMGAWFWARGYRKVAVACYIRSLRLQAEAPTYLKLAVCLDDIAAGLSGDQRETGRVLATEALRRFYRLVGTERERESAETLLRQRGKRHLVKAAKRG